MTMTYKFRGKSLKTGEWVYGFVWGSLDPHKAETSYRGWFIHNGVNIEQAIEVEERSIGMFTGLTDKNGVEIWEGDIRTNPWKEGEFGVVKYSETSAMFDFGMGYPETGSMMAEDSELLGNIHDTPSLLKGE